MTITTEQVDAKLRELATQYPGTHYSYDLNKGPSYLTGDAGGGVGCIFGQTFRALGVPKETLKEFEDQHRQAECGGDGEDGVLQLAKFLGIKDPNPRWEEVQLANDTQLRWKYAVQHLNTTSYL